MTDEKSFVVWLHSDPRNIGDYYSEVSRTVCFVGTEEECMKEYERRKGLMRWAGTDAEYVGYPKPNKEGFEKGHKIVEYPSRESIPSDELRELEEEYY